MLARIQAMSWVVFWPLLFDRVIGTVFAIVQPRMGTEVTALGRLFDTIRRLVLDGRYIVGQHAIERLDERGVLEWQVIDGIGEARLISERDHSLPNPSVEVVQMLADGSEVKVVWSLLI